MERKEETSTSWRQLKAMLRKNWLLKIRHPFVTCAEIFLPTVVMLLLIAVRTRVDTKIHPSQPYIRKDMFVQVGKDGTSPPFNQVLESLLAKGEFLAFAPDTSETRMMINILSLKFPLLKRHIKDIEPTFALIVLALIAFSNLWSFYINCKKALASYVFLGALFLPALILLVNLRDPWSSAMHFIVLPIKFLANFQCLYKLVTRVYKDESELETYIRSDLYGSCDQVK
ncbi:unnamed protein product [Ilex paraguariensis]|uniref:Uncharacterized protein n=1 Tax=Ilex paraguariensis TaxID=185542 RepID=A0ABC8SEK4_9AQUA